jgi:hypothetical protein
MFKIMVVAIRPFPIMLVKLAYYAHSNVCCFLKLCSNYAHFSNYAHLVEKKMLGLIGGFHVSDAIGSGGANTLGRARNLVPRAIVEWLWPHELS